MKNSRTSSLFSSVVFTILLAGGASLSQAATINVTASATDTLGGNGQCSLREAITNINDGANTYGDCTSGSYGSGDTINIPAGTYTTTIVGAGEDFNATGDFDINRSVAIVGAGSGSTIIGGGALDRVFHITGAYTVSFSGVTIQNGNTPDMNGGGIYNSSSGALTVTNSTITSNTATTNGGGIFNNGGTVTVTNSTIVRNTAGAGGGGGIWNQGGTYAFTNSIVADNGVGLDCAGTITDSGGNIDRDGSCGTFTQNAAMVQGTGFGALASNGGPTQTHALLQGSAAINAAPTCAALTTDQRGVARPQGSACDIGAYELAVAPAAIPTVNVWAMMIFMFFAGLGSLHYLRRK